MLTETVYRPVRRPSAHVVYTAFSLSYRVNSRTPGTFDNKWTLTKQYELTEITLPQITIIDIPDDSVITATVGISFLINGSVATTMSAGDKITVTLTTLDYEETFTGTVVTNGIDCAVSVTSRSKYIDDILQSVLDGTSQSEIDALPQYGA